MTRRYWKLGALALSSMALGAGASVIANAGAATSPRAGAASHAGTARTRVSGARALVRRAVQGTMVVADRSGHFVSVTFARGTVSAVNGQQLTIAEGTKKATYRTVTLTIPTTARIHDNQRLAALSDVKKGQRVTVLEAPQRTSVFARG